MAWVADGQVGEQIDLAAHQTELEHAAREQMLDGELVDLEARRLKRRQLLASVNRCLQQQGSGEGGDVMEV